MKKVLMLASLSLVLASCGSKTTPTTSVNLSGTWTTTGIQAGYTSSGTITLTQTSMNAAGDFVAAAKDSTGQLGSISGNINTGTIKMTILSGNSLVCTGAFSNNYAKYVGTCPTESSFGAGEITMTKN